MYGAAFLWLNLTIKYKNTMFLDEFTSKIKAWICDFCQCRLCKKICVKLSFHLKESIINIQEKKFKHSKTKIKI